MIAAKLDAALKAVCPIHGVSIGRVNDKQTWRIDFRDEATAQQRAAAQDVLDAFDPEAQTKDEQNAPILAALTASDVGMLRALEDGDEKLIAERKAERTALRQRLVK